MSSKNGSLGYFNGKHFASGIRLIAGIGLSNLKNILFENFILVWNDLSIEIIFWKLKKS